MNHTKSIFARGNNGPQYTATQYEKFAQDWYFEHQTSSPYYARSNGLAENAVVMRLLSKAKQDDKDPNILID